MARRTAHWARVASAIRKQQGVPWSEAKDIYRRLTKITKRDAGRPAGLVDLREQKDRIRSIRTYVETMVPKVAAAQRGSLEDRLDRQGMEGLRWRKDSERFADLGVPAYETERLARAVAGAYRDVKRTGHVSAKRKETVHRIIARLSEEWDVPEWEYYRILNSIYDDD